MQITKWIKWILWCPYFSRQKTMLINSYRNLNLVCHKKTMLCRSTWPSFLKQREIGYCRIEPFWNSGHPTAALWCKLQTCIFKLDIRYCRQAQGGEIYNLWGQDFRGLLKIYHYRSLDKALYLRCFTLPSCNLVLTHPGS